MYVSLISVAISICLVCSQIKDNSHELKGKSVTQTLKVEKQQKIEEAFLEPGKKYQNLIF